MFVTVGKATLEIRHRKYKYYKENIGGAGDVSQCLSVCQAWGPKLDLQYRKKKNCELYLKSETSTLQEMLLRK
jgi:hypothetical protein